MSVATPPIPDPSAPLVDEDMIQRVVHAFYGRVRLDPILGPIFAPVIGDDWTDHLARMCEFWSSVMLTSGRYKGSPMQAHMRLKALEPQHFAHWLDLFRESVRDSAPEAAPLFIAKAERIAESLQLGLFYRPTEGAISAPESRSGRRAFVLERNR